MLSKIDIQKELGTGISLIPFKSENIKENSINLSASCYAWTMSDGEVYKDKDKWILVDGESKKNKKIIKFTKGNSAVYNTASEKKEIIILPFSTTLIQTEEVLAVGNNIGGTYHSKVGLVSQGFGHIGTMLGPNFSGHSLIAIHNVSKEVLTIEIGKTFVSIVFNYLKTPISMNNPTKNGHLEKLSEFGIRLSQEDREFLDNDWKSDTNRVRQKLKEESSFKEYNQRLKKIKNEHLKKYLNKHNVILFGGVVTSLYLLYLWASKNPIWIERFWSVGFSGIFIFLFNAIHKLVKVSEL